MNVAYVNKDSIGEPVILQEGFFNPIYFNYSLSNCIRHKRHMHPAEYELEKKEKQQ